MNVDKVIAKKRTRLSVASLALLMFVMACEISQPYESFPMPEPLFRQMMDGQMAQDIAQSCESITLVHQPEIMKAKLLDDMLASGFAREDSLNRMQEARDLRGADYMRVYQNVLPIEKDNNYYCLFGSYEIANDTNIGHFLRRF